jgi:hypothetical protein
MQGHFRSECDRFSGESPIIEQVRCAANLVVGSMGLLPKFRHSLCAAETFPKLYNARYNAQAKRLHYQTRRKRLLERTIRLEKTRADERAWHFPVSALF